MSDQTKQTKEASDIAWGCAQIAEVIGRSERQTFHLCSKGYLPVSKVGGHWVGSRKRLRKHIGAEVE